MTAVIIAGALSAIGIVFFVVSAWRFDRRNDRGDW